ncbi:MAG: SAM-dependent chlorinase/fluorinase, partial [Thermodesulfobacteriota bacterium]|nr:SAM-dependent chlorinase/fluorinase [Thermodesulfobacteriota bacterium]
APDNGVLSLVLADEKVDRVFVVTNEKYFLTPVSSTFHGRDILAPVAAHLSKGAPMSSLGKEAAVGDVTTRHIPTPYLSSPRELVGRVLSIDRFGNLITNIDQHTLEQFQGKGAGADLVVEIGGSLIQGLSRSYDAVKKGAPLSIMGSRNLLEIAVNQEDARTYFRATAGQTVRVKRGTRG